MRQEICAVIMHFVKKKNNYIELLYLLHSLRTEKYVYLAQYFRHNYGINVGFERDTCQPPRENPRRVKTQIKIC